MLIIKDRDAASTVSDPAIRQMILQRIDAIASDEPFDSKLHGYFVFVEGDETLQAINKQVGFDLLAKPYETVAGNRQASGASIAAVGLGSLFAGWARRGAWLTTSSVRH